MFEAVKAKLLIWTANNTNLLLLPDDRGDKEIAESMLLEGAPIPEINKTSYELWLARLKAQ